MTKREAAAWSKGFDAGLEAITGNFMAGASQEAVVGFDAGNRAAMGGEVVSKEGRSEEFGNAWDVGFLVGMTKLGWRHGEPSERVHAKRDT